MPFKQQKRLLTLTGFGVWLQLLLSQAFRKKPLSLQDKSLEKGKKVCQK